MHVGWVGVGWATGRCVVDIDGDEDEMARMAIRRLHRHSRHAAMTAPIEPATIRSLIQMIGNIHCSIELNTCPFLRLRGRVMIRYYWYL
jgi:hypothetical protein